MKKFILILFILTIYSTNSLAENLNGYYELQDENSVFYDELKIKNYTGSQFDLEIFTFNNSRPSECSFQDNCKYFKDNIYICKAENPEDFDVEPEYRNGNVLLKIDNNVIDVISTYPNSFFCGIASSLDGRYTRFIPNNTESEYKNILNSWEPLEKVDNELNIVWKDITKNLSREEKNALLNKQREWLKRGRVSRVIYYLNNGDSKFDAFTKAVKDRCEELRNLKSISGGQIKNENNFLKSDNKSAGNKICFYDIINDDKMKKTMRQITKSDIEKGDQPVGQFKVGIIVYEKRAILKGILDYDSVNNSWVLTQTNKKTGQQFSVWFPIDKTKDEAASESMFSAEKYNGYIGFQAVTPESPIFPVKNYNELANAAASKYLSLLSASGETIKTRKFKKNVTLLRAHIKFPFTEKELWNFYNDQIHKQYGSQFD